MELPRFLCPVKFSILTLQILLTELEMFIRFYMLNKISYGEKIRGEPESLPTGTGVPFLTYMPVHMFYKLALLLEFQYTDIKLKFFFAVTYQISPGGERFATLFALVRSLPLVLVVFENVLNKQLWNLELRNVAAISFKYIFQTPLCFCPHMRTVLWRGDLQFNALFNSISIIPGRFHCYDLTTYEPFKQMPRKFLTLLTCGESNQLCYKMPYRSIFRGPSVGDPSHGH